MTSTKIPRRRGSDTRPTGWSTGRAGAGVGTGSSRGVGAAGAGVAGGAGENDGGGVVGGTNTGAGIAGPDGAGGGAVAGGGGAVVGTTRTVVSDSDVIASKVSSKGALSVDGAMTTSRIPECVIVDRSKIHWAPSAVRTPSTWPESQSRLGRSDQAPDAAGAQGCSGGQATRAAASPATSPATVNASTGAVSSALSSKAAAAMAEGPSTVRPTATPPLGTDSGAGRSTRPVWARHHQPCFCRKAAWLCVGQAPSTKAATRSTAAATRRPVLAVGISEWRGSKPASRFGSCGCHRWSSGPVGHFG